MFISWKFHNVSFLSSASSQVLISLFHEQVGSGPGKQLTPAQVLDRVRSLSGNSGDSFSFCINSF